MSIKKRIWGWIIAALLVAVGAGLYYGIPHFSRWVTELRVKAPNTADLGAEEKLTETPDKPAIKRGWSSKSIGLVVGLTVGGALFLGAVRRKQRLAKKAKGSPEPGLGVTTPAPTPATPAAGTTTTNTVVTKKEEKRAAWWNLDLDPIGKTVWPTFSLALVVFLLAMAVAVSRPDWDWNKVGIENHPKLWPLGLVIVALLILMTRFNMGVWIKRIMGLGLVVVIVLLLVDIFNIDIKQIRLPPMAPGRTTSAPVDAPEPTSGTIVVIAKPCQWSGWDIKIPDYCDFVTDPSADVEFENLFGERTIDGPDRVVHWGKNLPPQKRHFRVRALGHQDATVTVQWKRVNCK